MVSNSKTKISLNINWDHMDKIWHIMVKSQYIERKECTTIASCQYTKDKKPHQFNTGLFRDWLDRPIAQFPNGVNFHNGLYSHISINLDMICSKCLKQVKNIKEFKNWLIIQKLKYL